MLSDCPLFWIQQVPLLRSETAAQSPPPVSQAELQLASEHEQHARGILNEIEVQYVDM